MLETIEPKSKRGKQLEAVYFNHESGDIPLSTVVPEFVELPEELTKEFTEQETQKIEKKLEEPDFQKYVKQPSHEPIKKTHLSNHKLNLYDLVTFYKNEGIVGEEKLTCAMTLAGINGSSFGVEGFSGSGKTFIVDKLIDKLLPDVYRIQQSSDMAIFNDAERINGNKYIYIPELQKAMRNKKSPIIEVIKDLTEGKDANRIVTKKNGEGISEFTINKGITVIYTLALENDFKKDDESSRRLIRFNTDNSREHLEEIHTHKARSRYSLSKNENDIIELGNKVKNHVNTCLYLRDVEVIDLFANYISEVFPITQKSVGYIDHYYSLLDGCTKFHHNERQSVQINNTKYLLINLEDHFNVFNIYFNDYISSLKDLTKDKEEIIFNRPHWASCFNSGFGILRESTELAALRIKYPSLVHEWYSSQVNNNQILTTDFKSGEQRLITKINEVATNDLYK